MNHWSDEWSETWLRRARRSESVLLLTWQFWIMGESVASRWIQAVGYALSFYLISLDSFSCPTPIGVPPPSLLLSSLAPSPLPSCCHLPSAAALSSVPASCCSTPGWPLQPLQPAGWVLPVVSLHVASTCVGLHPLGVHDLGSCSFTLDCWINLQLYLR